MAGAMQQEEVSFNSFLISLHASHGKVESFFLELQDIQTIKMVL